MGSSLGVLEPYTPVVSPIDARFGRPAHDSEDGVRVYSINSTPSTTEVVNASNPQECYYVKTPLFSRSLWEAVDSEGRDLCQIKRKYLSFKSRVYVECGGKKREFTIDKPGSLMDMFEVYCGNELVFRVRDHLSSYNLEFYQVEKKCASSDEKSSELSEIDIDGSEGPARSEEEGEDPSETEEIEGDLGKMVAQVSSSFCSGVFLRASPDVDALLCGLVFLSVRSARYAQ